jgi:equilibrative nucleoside transporter 1/2/3
MTISMIVVTVVLVVTIILAALNTTSWTIAFFYLTMISIIILNMGAGVFQNLSYALAAQLPMRYTNAVMIGQNASGTAFAIALLVSISAAPDQQASAITYFCIALVFMIIMFFLFQSIFRNEYYTSVTGTAPAAAAASPEAGDGSSTYESFAADGDEAVVPLTAVQSMRKSWQLLSTCWTQVLNAFLVYFVGLSIFPVIQVGIKSTDSILSELYFTPVTCFLMFNATALIGTILTSGHIPIPGPRFLWIPVAARFLFIPFFLMCNYDPTGTRTLAVWFRSDWLYCVASGLQGLSMGYLGSLSVMYAPRIVGKEDAQTAGMMAGLACMLGMFTGVVTGFLWPVIFA